MLIDSLAIQLSGAVGMRAGTSAHALIDQKDVINGLHNLLVDMGWSSVGAHSSGTITYPLGFPTVPADTATPLRTVGCGFAFVRLDGVNYVPYNPYTETPVTGGTCKFFALDTTAAAGLDNLVAELSTSARFTASWAVDSAGHAVVTVTATGYGPDTNYTEFLGDGRWGAASDISAGGYTLTSVAESHTAQFSVKVTSAGGINPDSRHITRPIIIDLKTPYNSYGSTIFYLDTIIQNSFRPSDGSHGFGAAGYVMVANPYSFAVFCPDDDRVTAIFLAAPYVPANFSAAYAVFAAYPQLGDRTFWQSGAVSLDGAPQTNIGAAYPRMLAVRAPGTIPLVTPSGTPLITTAWVMFGRNATSTAAVVGKLWDAAMLNDVVDEGTIIAGKRYRRIAAQDGSGGRTRSSLMFRIS